MAEQIEVGLLAASANLDYGHVNAVGRGSAHHSGDNHRLRSALETRPTLATSCLLFSPTIMEKLPTMRLRVLTTLALGSAANPRSTGDRCLNASTRCAA